MRNLLEECRANLGPVPRKFRWEQRRYHKVRIPWEAEEDPLFRVFLEQKLLLERGKVVWAFVVMVNRSLFEPGPNDAPGVAVYSLDPRVDDNPAALEEVANVLGDLKGTQPSGDPQLTRIADILTGETERVFRFPLPRSISPHYGCYMTTFLGIRKHLPEGVLTTPLIPLLICPEETETTMIVPGRYWPDVLSFYAQICQWKNVGRDSD